MFCNLSRLVAIWNQRVEAHTIFVCFYSFFFYGFLHALDGYTKARFFFFSLDAN